MSSEVNSKVNIWSHRRLRKSGMREQLNIEMHPGKCLRDRDASEHGDACDTETRVTWRRMRPKCSREKVIEFLRGEEYL